ncbi:MAG: long-chain fatty acid--CoA ligase [Gemmatimonadetes bacterium]|nr:long-chain fatty acid--CoA ligase [Gemmatimonadota bacterium]
MESRPATRNYVANPAALPSGTLVGLFFEAIARQKADALRGKVGDEWRSWSHAEIEEHVRALAFALEALGVRRGDRVAILSENRPEWALADFATLCLGALDVPVYATLPANQIVHVLKDSGARVVFASTAEQLEKVRGVWPELPALEMAVVFDDVGTEDARVLSLARVLELGRRDAAADAAATFRQRALSARPDEVATILYTSGTTGQPKGVLLTHQNLYSNVRAVEELLPIGEHDVALSFAPLSHVLERLVDYFYFLKGCTIAYVRSFDLIPQALQEVRPTIIVSTPRLYEKMYARVMGQGGPKRVLVRWARAVAAAWVEAKLAGRRIAPWLALAYAAADRLVFRKLRARTGGRLRYSVAGGAPLNEAIAKFFYGAGILILEGYGLTETSPVTNVNTPSDFRFGTVGKPVPGTEIMIAPDGEVLIRGPQVMKGYYNLPDATREAIDPEGWFHTGDIGEVDAEGFLRITDRKKNLIVTAGGKNIAPAPIEQRVTSNRFVAEAVMIGDRRPYPVLLVVPNFDTLGAWASEKGISARTPAALIEDERVKEKLAAEVFGVLQGLARFETPKRIALLAEELSIERGELTPTLKVRRRVVEDHHRELIESLYADHERAVADGR